MDEHQIFVLKATIEQREIYILCNISFGTSAKTGCMSCDKMFATFSKKTKDAWDNTATLTTCLNRTERSPEKPAFLPAMAISGHGNPPITMSMFWRSCRCYLDIYIQNTNTVIINKNNNIYICRI